MRIMRFAIVTLAVATLPALPATSSVRAYEKPYDPYPWCAAYGDDMSGVSNCGFLTWEQCMATVSGVGGFCEPNQFYNPRGKKGRHHRARRSYHR
jgi:Protein of unknown function (DUF3551)